MLGRNAAAGLRHEIDHIEPSGKGSGGLVEDRSRRRGELPAAVIAPVNLALGNPVKLLFLSATPHLMTSGNHSGEGNPGRRRHLETWSGRL